MTNEEFSNEFDVLYNSITSNQAPGLDEYEKSVFLTKAQDEIILQYFNPKGNKFQEGFDSTRKRQIDFKNLLRTIRFTQEYRLDKYTKNLEKFDNRSIVFPVPDDVEYVSVCKVSGGRALESCGDNVKTEIYVTGTAPDRYCTYHSSAWVGYYPEGI